MVDFLTALPTVVGLADRARELLRSPHFSRSLATRVHQICKKEHKFSFSKRALKSWLRSDEAWLLLTSLDRERLPEITTEIHRAVIPTTRKLATKLAILRSQIVARRLMSEFLAHLDPSYTGALLYQWLETKFVTDADLSSLPLSCWNSWKRLHTTNSGTATNLKHLLDDHRSNMDVIGQIVEEPDSDTWISSLPYQAWEVLGYYFLAHHAPARAAAYFLRALRLGAPNRAILFSWAAWALREINDEEALHLATKATHEEDETGISSGMYQLLSGCPDGTLASLPAPLSIDKDTNIRLLGVTLRVAALVELDRRTDAIDLLRAAVKANPDRGMLRLLLVQVISDYVATLPTGSMEGEMLLAGAADHAAKAISSLRRWSGPVEIATAFACRFYYTVGDLQRVLEIGLPPPRGTAVPGDLNPEVRLLVIMALVMLGDLRSAAEMSRSEDATDFETFYLEAVSADLSGEPGALECYYRALDVATTSEERFLVLMALARQGITDVKSIDDLELRSSEVPDLIRSAGSLAAGDYPAALLKSRCWREQSGPHALIHAEALYRSGKPAAAIDELLAAANRFRDAHFVALAVGLQIEEGDVHRAFELALDGLARYQGSRPARWQLRYHLIEISGDRGDWSAAEGHSRSLIDEFPEDPRPVWLLIQSLAQRQRHQHAWEVLQDHQDLEVLDEATATMKVQLRCRFEQTLDVIEMALGLIEEYPDSEVVAATAIQGVLSIAQHLDLPEELESESAQLIPRFIDRFPDSPYLWPVAIDMQDPVESLRPYLEPQAAIREELLRRALYGEIPMGLASDLCGEPYILHCFASSRCSIPVNNQEAETSAAAASLGSDIVVDTSALVPFIQLDKPVWIAQYFERLLIPDVLVDDVHGAIDYVNTRGSGTMGWDVLADRFTARELTPEDITEARLPLERLLEIVSATLDAVSSAQAPALPGLESDDFGPWIAPVRVAKERNIPLYSDDLALRNLARAVGVTAFDNYAVIQALLANGRIDSDVSEGRCRDLMRAHVMDVPFDELRYSEMAAENDFGPGPVTVSLARPAAWIDPRRTAQWFTIMTRRIHEAGQSDQVPFWLASASVGATLNAPAYNRLVILGQLLAASLTQSRLFVDIVPQLVAASRQAARYLGLDPNTSDPLRASIPIIMGAVRATSNQMGEMAETSNLGNIGSTTLQMFEALPPEDKQIVVEAIITDR